MRRPAYETATVESGKIHPNPWNPNQMDARTTEAERESIRLFGFIDPITVRKHPEFDGHYQVIDGEHRWKIGQQEGHTEFPINIVELDDAHAKKLTVVMNETRGSPDPMGLSVLLAEMQEEFGDALGDALPYNEKELDAFIKMAEADGGFGIPKPDVIPEPPDEPVTQDGDVWLMGNHKLICGSSEDPATLYLLFEGQKADLVITSPPYNQKLDTFKASGMQKENPAWVERMASAYSDSKPEDDYQEGQRALLDSIYEHTGDDASIFYNHKHRYREKQVVSPLRWIWETKWVLRQEIVWDRGGSITLNARMFMPIDERIYWLTKGDFYFDDTSENKALSTIWKIAPKAEAGVTAPFPIDLPTRIITSCSKAKQLIFDPYMGSGTVLIASQSNNRRCYGVELSPAYCDVIVTRWEKYTGLKAERISA